jgi:hypothetical protein
MPPVVLR